jgi:hypothetical protein
MNYHLNRDGQDLGIFPLEELQRRRAAGELTGNELVWTQGMQQWRTLDLVLRRGAPDIIAPGVPASQKSNSNKTLFVVLVIVVGLILAGAMVVGVVTYRIIHLVQPTLKQLETESTSEPFVQMSAMDAASKPILSDSNTLTVADVVKTAREFRMRQYVEGYKSRGERNPTCDALALGLVSNWIACNYDGTVDTNLPPLSELSDRLANDPACTDPLVLTVAAVNSVELHEGIRRLERAVKKFENSKHLGYPKFFATVTLGDKLIYDKTDRLPVLDAQALQYLEEALTDGSVRPEDQAEIADILIMGWGRGFFDRNAEAIYTMVQGQGEAYKWLALVLEGEHGISAAWEARGGGYTDSVSSAGWNGFSDHLAVARKCFTRAWNLRPELPLAPCRMIYVSLGDAGIGEMRLWFDRTVAAQIDYAQAWSNMRWGLRPRWYGDTDSMLAFGLTALNTRRFDTDVPRKFFDSVADVESELQLPQGQHIYGREDIWPHFQELYEGYIAEPSVKDYLRDGWRSSYTVVAYLAGKYDVARKQLQVLSWQPHQVTLTGWGVDLTVMPLEVAARTGSQSEQVEAAESRRQTGDVAGALTIYSGLATSTNADEMTSAFAQERLATLGVEQHLQAGGWVDFLPTDTNFTGWHIAFGKCELLPDGALQVRSDEKGHMLYSRVRMGTEFEVRGQFEVVSSTTKAFQAGLVMGIPQFETYNWYAFRMKRNNDEGNVASFSQHWTKRQILAPVILDSRTNSFYFRLHDGLISATVDGQEVFKNVEPPKDSYVTTNEFLLGLGAFNDSNSSVIRYRNIQVRRPPSE